MKLDDEVDRLYQVPLKEFTAARNALAKDVAGADATRVRRLQKPNTAAWAVNQLYWRDRKVYDELVTAAEELRTVHRALLAGKNVDLHKAEAAHRDAIRAATAHVRQILAESGEPASQQTMTAVGETLEALPSAQEAPGRLTRPLRRMGFEALAGVPARPPGAGPKLSLVTSREKKPAPKPEMSAAKKREIDEIETRLRAAQTEERQLQADVERGRRELDRAERERGRAEQELADATEKVERLQAELAVREKAHKSTAAEQEKLERRLERLRTD